MWTLEKIPLSKVAPWVVMTAVICSIMLPGFVAFVVMASITDPTARAFKEGAEPLVREIVSVNPTALTKICVRNATIAAPGTEKFATCLATDTDAGNSSNVYSVTVWIYPTFEKALNGQGCEGQVQIIGEKTPPRIKSINYQNEGAGPGGQ
jgi:hypothetical protein